jgi:hypothetical protein
MIQLIFLFLSYDNQPNVTLPNAKWPKNISGYTTCRGEQRLTRENIQVVLAEFSTLSLAVLLHSSTSL